MAIQHKTNAYEYHEAVSNVLDLNLVYFAKKS